MKRTIQATIVVMLLVAAGVAAAADTATVAVSARVVGTCRFSTAGATLAFGDLPFDANGAALGLAAPLTTSINFWCTNGATYTITDDNGTNPDGFGGYQMVHATMPAQLIAYSFTYADPSGDATGSGLGPLSPITLTITGNVGATYGGNAPGDYSDTVTLTITP